MQSSSASPKDDSPRSTAEIIHGVFNKRTGSQPNEKPPKRPTPKETRSKFDSSVLKREYANSAKWILDYVNLAGNPSHKTLGDTKQMSELEACIRAREIREAIRDGRNPFAGDITVEDYFDTIRAPWSLANKRSAKDEIGVFNRYARRKLGRLLMRNVRAHHIQAAIDDFQAGETPTARRKKLEAGTIYQFIAVMKALMKWAYRRGDIVADPTLTIRQVKLNNTRLVRYSAPELAAIGAQLEFAAPELRLLFEMLLAIAVRVREILDARHDDIDEAACTLMLRNTKSGRPFLVPCPPAFMRAYQEAKMLRRPDNPHIIQPDHGPGPMATPYRAWKKLLIDAGITERRIFHDARRTVCSEAINTPGVTLHDVSRSLNHANVTITAQRYLVTGDDRIRHTLMQSSARLDAMLRRDCGNQTKFKTFVPLVSSVLISAQIRMIFAGRCAMHG